MPALRPIFKRGKGRTHDASGYVAEESRWSPSKRAKMTNPDGTGPFMALSQSGSSREEIDLSDWEPSAKNNTYRVKAAAGCEEPEQDSATDGIGRDVTVTVVYGKPRLGVELRA
jgi:hypothetical protein